MLFLTLDRDADSPPGPKPCVLLWRDPGWNDYAYVTQFRALYIGEMIDGKADVIEELGEVKIMRKGQQPDHAITPVPDTFERLGEEYGSLGQSDAYYERLASLGPKRATEVLDGLRDLGVDLSRRASFELEPAYKTSLLRTTGAERALKRARDLFSEQVDPSGTDTAGGADFSFEFVTRVGSASAPHRIPFDFTPHSDLPYRINVLVGRNGTGKTQVMANLAVVQSGTRSDPEIPAEEHGAFSPRRKPFARVGAVSYSAFDAFALPGGDRLADGPSVGDHSEPGGSDVKSKIAKSTYFYIGIRKKDGKIKTAAILEDEFKKAKDDVEEQGRTELWLRTLRPILADPAFGVSSVDDIADGYASFGSGQRAVLSILTEIVAQADYQSLLLVDEPENHLHPPLVAGFLHSLRQALDELDSYAVVATHSPVVVQETPARYVHVLRRVGHNPSVRPPRIETFGEDLGRITEEVFGLSTDDANFYNVLTAWAEAGRSVESIEAEMRFPMSYPARAFYLSLRPPSAT